MASGKPRDPIISESSSGDASPKRADLLNGSPRTKSVNNGGPNLRTADDQKHSWPVPDRPYGKGE